MYKIIKSSYCESTLLSSSLVILNHSFEGILPIGWATSNPSFIGGMGETTILTN